MPSLFEQVSDGHKFAKSEWYVAKSLLVVRIGRCLLDHMLMLRYGCELVTVAKSDSKYQATPTAGRLRFDSPLLLAIHKFGIRHGLSLPAGGLHEHSCSALLLLLFNTWSVSSDGSALRKCPLIMREVCCLECCTRRLNVLYFYLAFLCVRIDVQVRLENGFKRTELGIWVKDSAVFSASYIQVVVGSGTDRPSIAGDTVAHSDAVSSTMVINSSLTTNGFIHVLST